LEDVKQPASAPLHRNWRQIAANLNLCLIYHYLIGLRRGGVPADRRMAVVSAKAIC